MKMNWFKIYIKHLISLIGNSLEYDTRGNFINLLIYLKQGKTCKDCEKYFGYCECNFCENCRFRYCICDINTNRLDLFFTSKDKYLVNKKLIQLIKYNFNKQNIKEIIINLDKRIENLFKVKDELSKIRQEIENLL